MIGAFPIAENIRSAREKSLPPYKQALLGRVEHAQREPISMGMVNPCQTCQRTRSFSSGHSIPVTAPLSGFSGRDEAGQV